MTSADAFPQPVRCRGRSRLNFGILVAGGGVVVGGALDRTTVGKVGKVGKVADKSRVAVGKYGEDVAVRHLLAAGFAVLERNWRCRDGEIDVVASEGGVLVFCEVKTRSDIGFGTPLDAVTPAKAARLRRLASRWLTEWRTATSANDAGPRGFVDVRFDVVSVLLQRSGAPIVEHLRGAF